MSVGNEKISRSQACDPKGLWVCLPLLKGLVELSPICEIHGACLRQAMFQVLLGEPSLNSTKWNGSVWVGLKVERITILLSHMRRLLGQNEMQACASKLTGAEFLQLQEVVKMIQQKKQVAADPTLAEREKGNPTLVEREKADPALAEREASHTPLPERGPTFFSFERVNPFSSYQVLGCWWFICFFLFLFKVTCCFHIFSHSIVIVFLTFHS